MRSNAAGKGADHFRSQQANALLRDLRDAGDSLQACLRELEKVLAQPTFDAGALTSVRLKLAGLRLTRGPLINRVFDVLAGSLSPAEDAMLSELRSSHNRILRTATMHTAKWTLDAIGKNWLEYRRETRELMRKWAAKTQRDQQLMFPLIQKCVQSA